MRTNASKSGVPAVWDDFGASWDVLGASEGLLGVSWEVLGGSWGGLGGSWGGLGGSWGALGGSWAVLWRSWGDILSSPIFHIFLIDFGPRFDRVWSPKGCPEGGAREPKIVQNRTQNESKFKTIFKSSKNHL